MSLSHICLSICLSIQMNFEALAHEIVVAGKPKICRVGSSDKSFCCGLESGVHGARQQDGGPGRVFRFQSGGEFLPW